MSSVQEEKKKSKKKKIEEDLGEEEPTKKKKRKSKDEGAEDEDKEKKKKKIVDDTDTTPANTEGVGDEEQGKKKKKKKKDEEGGGDEDTGTSRSASKRGSEDKGGSKKKKKKGDTSESQQDSEKKSEAGEKKSEGKNSDSRKSDKGNDKTSEGKASESKNGDEKASEGKKSDGKKSDDKKSDGKKSDGRKDDENKSDKGAVSDKSGYDKKSDKGIKDEEIKGSKKSKESARKKSDGSVKEVSRKNSQTSQKSASKQPSAGKAASEKAASEKPSSEKATSEKADTTKGEPVAKTNSIQSSIPPAADDETSALIKATLGGSALVALANPAVVSGSTPGQSGKPPASYAQPLPQSQVVAGSYDPESNLYVPGSLVYTMHQTTVQQQKPRMSQAENLVSVGGAVPKLQARDRWGNPISTRPSQDTVPAFSPRIQPETSPVRRRGSNPPSALSSDAAPASEPRAQSLSPGRYNRDPSNGPATHYRNRAAELKQQKTDAVSIGGTCKRPGTGGKDGGLDATISDNSVVAGFLGTGKPRVPVGNSSGKKQPSALGTAAVRKLEGFDKNAAILGPGKCLGLAAKATANTMILENLIANLGNRKPVIGVATGQNLSALTTAPNFEATKPADTFSATAYLNMLNKSAGVGNRAGSPTGVQPNSFLGTMDVGLQTSFRSAGTPSGGVHSGGVPSIDSPSPRLEDPAALQQVIRNNLESIQNNINNMIAQSPSNGPFANSSAASGFQNNNRKLIPTPTAGESSKNWWCDDQVNYGMSPGEEAKFRRNKRPEDYNTSQVAKRHQSPFPSKYIHNPAFFCLSDMVNELAKIVRQFAILNDRTMTIGEEKAIESLIRGLSTRLSQFEFDKPQGSKAPKLAPPPGAAAEKNLSKENENQASMTELIIQRPEPPKADRPNLVRPGLEKMMHKEREIARKGGVPAPPPAPSQGPDQPNSKVPPNLLGAIGGAIETKAILAPLMKPMKRMEGRIYERVRRGLTEVFCYYARSDVNYDAYAPPQWISTRQWVMFLRGFEMSAITGISFSDLVHTYGPKREPIEFIDFADMFSNIGRRVMELLHGKPFEELNVYVEEPQILALYRFSEIFGFHESKLTYRQFMRGREKIRYKPRDGHGDSPRGKRHKSPRTFTNAANRMASNCQPHGPKMNFPPALPPQRPNSYSIQSSSEGQHFAHTRQPSDPIAQSYSHVRQNSRPQQQGHSRQASGQQQGRSTNHQYKKQQMGMTMSDGPESSSAYGATQMTGPNDSFKMQLQQQQNQILHNQQQILQNQMLQQQQLAQVPVVGAAARVPGQAQPQLETQFTQGMVVAPPTSAPPAITNPVRAKISEPATMQAISQSMPVQALQQPAAIQPLVVPQPAAIQPGAHAIAQSQQVVTNITAHQPDIQEVLYQDSPSQRRLEEQQQQAIAQQQHALVQQNTEQLAAQQPAAQQLAAQQAPQAEALAAQRAATQQAQQAAAQAIQPLQDAPVTAPPVATPLKEKLELSETPAAHRGMKSVPFSHMRNMSGNSDPGAEKRAFKSMNFTVARKATPPDQPPALNAQQQAGAGEYYTGDDGHMYFYDPATGESTYVPQPGEVENGFVPNEYSANTWQNETTQDYYDTNGALANESAKYEAVGAAADDQAAAGYDGQVAAAENQAEYDAAPAQEWTEDYYAPAQPETYEGWYRDPTTGEWIQTEASAGGAHQEYRADSAEGGADAGYDAAADANAGYTESAEADPNAGYAGEETVAWQPEYDAEGGYYDREGGYYDAFGNYWDAAGAYYPAEGAAAAE